MGGLVALTLFGLPVIAMGVIALRDSLRLRTRGATATAYYMDRSRNGATYINCSFTTPDGRRIERGYAHSGVGLRPGDAVEIVYDPARPRNSCLAEERSTNWRLGAFFVSIGVGLTGSGLVGLAFRLL
ncbi:DUF3592 domain-containing protein [Streptomyces sp. NPDC003247]|uniref:DUF3592 domain-containing protein n=1 Tax=Streptomyces sp. NPDC003247 TaxID=3364677 RepID=UPI0036C966AC